MRLVSSEGRIVFQGQDVQGLKSRRLRPLRRELQMVFVEDWLFETGKMVDEGEAFPAVERAGDEIVQVVPSGPGQRTQAFRDLMVAAVHEANERVVVTTPYFVPDSAFLLSLRLAAMGGLNGHGSIKPLLIMPMLAISWC